jgi:hypothetical protein
LARTTAERWHQVHGLVKQGLGLLECSRRLILGLNTVKRYARASEPTRMQRVPKYRPTLVDPYRDHLRQRRAEQPGVPLTQLLAEIRALGVAAGDVAGTRKAGLCRRWSSGSWSSTAAAWSQGPGGS